MIFLTSDEHFGHKNIINYENRPFPDLLTMRESLINNWNSVVSNEDVVYCLGDFCLLNKSTAKEIVARLNGYKILIRGNHDNHNIQWYLDIGFNEVCPYRMLCYDNLKILLTHRPYSIPLEFTNMPFDLHIYGHVHSKGIDTGEFPTFAKDGACVCVERTNYTPISLDEVIKNCNYSENMFSKK